MVVVVPLRVPSVCLLIYLLCLQSILLLSCSIFHATFSTFLSLLFCFSVQDSQLRQCVVKMRIHDCISDCMYKDVKAKEMNSRLLAIHFLQFLPRCVVSETKIDLGFIRPTHYAVHKHAWRSGPLSLGPYHKCAVFMETSPEVGSCSCVSHGNYEGWFCSKWHVKTNFETFGNISRSGLK